MLLEIEREPGDTNLRIGALRERVDNNQLNGYN